MGGGVPYPNFKFLGKPLLGEKYVEGRKKKKNKAKFSGHYVCPHTHNLRVHVLRSHQLNHPDKKLFMT